MARTVADCASLDTVITGTSVPNVTLSEVRIGVPRPDYWEKHYVDQGLAKVMQDALSALSDAGAHLVEVDFERIVRIAGDNLDAALRRVERILSLRDWLAEHLPDVTVEQVYGRRPVPEATPLPELSQAEVTNTISMAMDEYAEVFLANNIAAIAFPTIPIPAQPRNHSGEFVGQMVVINGQPINEVEAIISNIFWGPRLGAPGLNILVGLTQGACLWAWNSKDCPATTAAFLG